MCGAITPTPLWFQGVWKGTVTCFTCRMAQNKSNEEHAKSVRTGRAQLITEIHNMKEMPWKQGSSLVRRNKTVAQARTHTTHTTHAHKQHTPHTHTHTTGMIHFQVQGHFTSPFHDITAHNAANCLRLHSPFKSWRLLRVTVYFNNQKHCFFPTLCICLLSMVLIINRTPFSPSRAFYVWSL